MGRLDRLPERLLDKIETYFLGTVAGSSLTKKQFSLSTRHSYLFSQSSDKPSDIDGNPISDDDKDDEDLDGIPLDGAALLKSAMIRGIPGANPADNRMREMERDSEDDDIDGVPCKINDFHSFTFLSLTLLR